MTSRSRGRWARPWWGASCPDEAEERRGGRGRPARSGPVRPAIGEIPRLASICAAIRPREDRDFGRRQRPRRNRGPDGPLISIGLASSAPAEGAPAPDPSKTPACNIDDLQLIRFAEPPASYEMDITQDEARLIVGDQLFGSIVKADSERVAMTIPWQRPVSLLGARSPAFIFAGLRPRALRSRDSWLASSGGPLPAETPAISISPKERSPPSRTVRSLSRRPIPAFFRSRASFFKDC